MLQKSIVVLRYVLVLATILMFSCEKENFEPEGTQEETDLMSQLDPVSKDIPSVVQKQLKLTSENLEKYMNKDLLLVDFNVLGKLSTEKSVEVSQKMITNPDAFVAMGNVAELSTVKLGRMQKMFTGAELIEAQKSVKSFSSQEIKSGDNILEITWESKGETFKTLCFYRNSGIVWDNVLTGLFIMDKEAKLESNQSGFGEKGSKAVVSDWYKAWWEAKWLWGSKRGEMGYKITIYYNRGSSTVNNTDVEDWGYISLGKAESHSKIVKNSGSYGKCKYALGLCTPIGSLKFEYEGFEVSFKGLGSNIVANGYKSLYP